MHLREFIASDPLVLAHLPSEEVLAGDQQKVLGITWNLREEKLIWEFPTAKDQPMTRRGVLSVLASFFDPLGLGSPCLVKAKIFLQTLWEGEKGWDGPLRDEQAETWKKLTAEWQGSSLSFPRLTPASRANIQLHIFSDAGPDAYAAVAYLRAEREGQVESSILFAKSRLRPKKMDKNDGLTIPKLELLGLLIAVRIKNFIISNFAYPIENITFWCDSQIVLSWLASTEHQPTFVLNRLREIRREKTCIFRYVPSQSNPADIGARGASPSELENSSLWKYGPPWLISSPDSWPDTYRKIVLPPEVPELAPPVTFVAAAIREQGGNLQSELGWGRSGSIFLAIFCCR